MGMTKQATSHLADLGNHCLVQIASYLDLPSLSRWSRTGKIFRFLLTEAVRARIESDNLHRLQNFKFIQSVTIIHLGLSKTKRMAFRPKEINLVADLDIHAKSLDGLKAIPLERLEDLKARGHIIEQIGHLPVSLKAVDLAYNRLRNICSFTKLEQMQWLDLANNQIQDISALARLKGLRHLSLYHNKIADFGPLAKLTNLVHLNLSGNRGSDFTFLKTLTKLKYLSLQGYRIENVMIVAHLINLTYLDLSKNRIRDVRPLLELQQLETLYLCRNPIQDPRLLVRLPNLKNMRMGPNAGYAIFQAATNLRKKGINVRMLLR